MGQPKTFFFLNAAFLTTFCFSVGGPLGALGDGQEYIIIHYYSERQMLLSTVANQRPLSFSERRSPVERGRARLPEKITRHKNFVVLARAQK